MPKGSFLQLVDGNCAAAFCDPCCQDECPCCGKSIRYTVDVSFVGDWEIFGQVHPTLVSQECGCDDSGTPLASGSGAENDVIIDQIFPYWQSDEGLGCCLEIEEVGVGIIDFDSNVTITECVVTDEGNFTGQWATTLQDNWDSNVEAAFDINSGAAGSCCNCDWDGVGGKETSLRDVTDVTVAAWAFPLFEANFPDNCESVICIWNRKIGINQYEIEYSYFIDTECCTREGTGLVTGATADEDEFGSPFNLDGPDNYTPLIYEGSIATGNLLSAQTITDATARDLLATFADDDNNTINQLGRIDTVIFGVKCDDSEVLLETYTGMVYSEGNIVSCDVTQVDTVKSGGFHGQWVPDIVSGYKAFHIFVTVRSWDEVIEAGHIASSHGGDPGGQAVLVGNMAADDFIIPIDAAHHDC